jgi:predicted CoA-binding protein
LRTDEDTARAVLRDYRTWAVVGASDDPWRSSSHVMEQLVEHGFEVVPVNPRYDTVLGRRCYPSLRDLPMHVDVVDLFRRSEETAPHVDEAIAIGAKVLWTQLGVEPPEDALRRARDAGLTLVINRCPAQDLSRIAAA